MSDCIFCKIINKEITTSIVFENDHWLAFLDIKPINLGHTLLIPKAHYKNLFDLPTDLLAEVGPLLQKIGQAVKTVTNADGLNIGMNNESAAGQLVFHAHIHLIPRFTADNLQHWPGKENISKEDFATIASELRFLAMSH